MEKKSAVRAFCTETSQLNRVESAEVKNEPRITGGLPAEFGLFTTDIKTCAACPRGNRIPARVVRARFAAATMIFVTSAALRRATALGSATPPGSAIIGMRISPAAPPSVSGGYEIGPGPAVTGKAAKFAPMLPNGAAVPRLVSLST